MKKNKVTNMNNRLISRVYDYRNSFDTTPVLSYNRKLDDSMEITVNPPLHQSTMEYIIKNSSMVRKCSDILSKDILYNNVQIEGNESWYNDNKEDLYYMGLDYYSTGYAVCIILDEGMNIQQVPSISCTIIRQDNDYYLKQTLNGKWYYYNIYGITQNEKYENTVYIVGGDNLYSFYSLPKYYNCKEEVFIDILLSERNFKHIENNLIPSSILHINMEPNIENEDNVNTISEELVKAKGGTSVIFTSNENNHDIDYLKLDDTRIDDIITLNGQSERSILNMYNIPLERLLINENKESMNSNKFSNIWEIYIANLRAESSVWINFISQLLELNPDNITIEYPVFSDNKANELDNIIKLWNNNLIPYNVAIDLITEYYPDLDVGTLKQTFNNFLNKEINGSANDGFELL